MRKIKDKIKLRYKIIDISDIVKEKSDLDRVIEEILRNKMKNFEKNNRAIIYYL